MSKIDISNNIRNFLFSLLILLNSLKLTFLIKKFNFHLNKIFINNKKVNYFMNEKYIHYFFVTYQINICKN